MSSSYISSSLTSMSDKSDKTRRKRRRESLVNTKITELDLVSNEVVTIRGYRFSNQMKSHRLETIIWVRNFSTNVNAKISIQKGFKCLLMKRKLTGLEWMSDIQLIRMQPVMNNGIVPMHHYIQTVDDDKFLVFIYKAHFKNQVRLNGDDKTLENYFCGIQNW